jgi:hypothetical protein
MNPLGWKSAIYDLGRSEMPMADVADSLLQGVRGIEPDARLAGDALVDDVGTARQYFAVAVDGGRLGGAPDEVAKDLRLVRLRLQSAEGAGLSNAATGRVTAARLAAEDAIENLRRGIGPDSADESTHVALWSLRHNLDEAWNELGTQKVMGGLRGVISA